MSSSPGIRHEITERGTRAAYEMFKSGKFTTQDIARLMEISEATAYNAIHRYREAVRRAKAA